MRDVAVIGAGPAGSIAARSLASRHDVVVLERRAAPGMFPHCAGLLSDEVITMSGASPDILNSLYGAKVVFPDGESVTVRSDRPKVRFVDRAEFDVKMADSAMKAGADYIFESEYRSHSIEGDCVSVDSSSGEVRARALVGADGHYSRVAESFGGNLPREYLRGMQTDARMEAEDQGLITIRLGSRYAPGFFTWEVPCGDTVRVGLCASWSAGPPKPYLDRLLDDIGARPGRIMAGVIPVGGRRTTYGERCLLAGDAAGLVKPVSAGGLYPAFKAAPHLCDVLSGALQDGDMSARRLSAYERRWRAELGKGLDRGYRLRKAFVRMDDGDLSEAGRFARRDDVRPFLDAIDFDHPELSVSGMLRRPGIALGGLRLLARLLI